MKPVDIAITAIRRMTEIISNIGFSFGTSPREILVVGTAEVDGKERGVIAELTAEGQARVLAIAIHPDMKVEKFEVEFARMDEVGAEATEQIQQAIQSEEGTGTPFDG